MDQILKGLLAAALAMCSAVQAAKLSNHTYLKLRDTHSHNLSLTHHGHVGSAKKMGASVHVAGFYRTSHNAADAATFFGGGQSADANQTGRIEVQSSTVTTKAQGLAGNQLDHTPTTPASAMTGTVLLAPKRTEMGGQLGWHQTISAIEGLSFSIKAPVVKVDHELGYSISNGTANAEATDGQVGTGLAQYFSGTTFTKTAKAKQAGLSALKMDATKRSKTSVPDVTASINYQFVKEADYGVTGHLNFLIPTSSKPEALFLFEPTAGTAGKFAFGGGLNADFNLWKHATKDMALALKFGACYRYIFEGEETRVLGIYNHRLEQLVNAGHYRNVAAHAGVTAIPAANVLKRQVMVTPGSHFDGTISLGYSFKKVSVDAYYNLYFSEGESVTVKNSNKWFDGQYGFVASAADFTTAGGVVVGKDTFTAEGPIQAERNKSVGTASNGTALGTTGYTQVLTNYVTTDACTNPSQVTHKVGGAIRFAGFEKLPVNFTIGGGYEFDAQSSNRSLTSWELWAKLGFSF